MDISTVKHSFKSLEMFKNLGFLSGKLLFCISVLKLTFITLEHYFTWTLH